jgi:Pyruvate/2-oxoacid:ferredoxin oxidoreductase gamma subunit
MLARASETAAKAAEPSWRANLVLLGAWWQLARSERLLTQEAIEEAIRQVSPAGRFRHNLDAFHAGVALELERWEATHPWNG